MLHWVFKVADRNKTIHFYRNVLGMRVLRHEEFEEGCDAQCNGYVFQLTFMSCDHISYHYAQLLVLNYHNFISFLIWCLDHHYYYYIYYHCLYYNHFNYYYHCYHYFPFFSFFLMEKPPFIFHKLAFQFFKFFIVS